MGWRRIIDSGVCRFGGKGVVFAECQSRMRTAIKQREVVNLKGVGVAVRSQPANPSNVIGSGRRGSGDGKQL